MGESQNQPFQLSFNRFLRVDFQGSRVTSDGGLLVVRELDERLGLTGLIQNYLLDSGTGRNTQFPLADLFRLSVKWSRRGFVRGTARMGRVYLALALLSPFGVPPYASEAKPVLGYVADSNANPERLAAFRQGLKGLGYIEGRNLTIEFRLAKQQSDYPRLMADLVAEPVDIILAGNAAAAIAAAHATHAIPIVMAAVNDPVGLGLVKSLRRPGTNLTGTTNYAPHLIGERLQILNKIVPGLGRVSMILNGANPNNPAQFELLKSAAQTLSIEVQPLSVRAPEDIPGAFSSASAFGAKGLLDCVDNFITTQRFTITRLADRDHLAAIYTDREFVLAGGLMSLGPGHLEGYRRAAEYVDLILRGANPADLPVATPTQFTFTVSRSALNNAGLTLPSEIRARVDEWLP